MGVESSSVLCVCVHMGIVVCKVLVKELVCPIWMVFSVCLHVQMNLVHDEYIINTLISRYLSI